MVTMIPDRKVLQVKFALNIYTFYRNNSSQFKMRMFLQEVSQAVPHFLADFSKFHRCMGRLEGWVGAKITRLLTCK